MKPNEESLNEGCITALQAYDHARHDPGHVMAPGLFRSLKKGDYERLKLDVVYEYGDGRKIEFSGPEPLGVPEMRLLQGLIAMAGPDGVLLLPEPKTDAGRRLRGLMEMKWDAVSENSLITKGSYTTLLRAVGLENCGQAFRQIRASIERMWKVSVIVQEDGKRRGFRLLSDYASDEREGNLFVALNPRIAKAILGESHYCRIELDEVRLLKGDVAALLHQRLCGWINQGATKKISMDSLVEYAWKDAASGSAERMRRMRIRGALSELSGLGWGVSEYSKGKFEISRPPYKVEK